MGEKKHINKIPPKIPGQSRENFVYVFCSLCVFSLPNIWGSNVHPELRNNSLKMSLSPEMLGSESHRELRTSLMGLITQSAPKERRRRRAEKRSSKRGFLESPFLLCPPKVFSCLRGKP